MKEYSVPELIIDKRFESISKRNDHRVANDNFEAMSFTQNFKKKYVINMNGVNSKIMKKDRN